MSSEVVFAAYKPKTGKEKEFLDLLSKHVPTLRKLEMLTDRKEVIVRSKNGTIVEVFEWRSKDAVNRAHEHPAVAQIWESMGQLAEFVGLNTLEETAKPFSHFSPV